MNEKKAWSPEQLEAWSQRVHFHPWATPRREDDEGPQDEGDPRDMAPPTPRFQHEGMTVVDAAAWARLIAAVSETATRRLPRVWGSCMAASAFGAAVERSMRSFPALPFSWHVSFVLKHSRINLGSHPATTARLLQAHWVYGALFTAWWQTKHSPRAIHIQRIDPLKNAKTENGKTLGVEVSAGRSSADPRPTIELPDGTTLRCDELWVRHSGGGTPGLAVAEGACYAQLCGQWSPIVTGTTWTDVSTIHDFRCVYPPLAPVEPESPQGKPEKGGPPLVAFPNGVSRFVDQLWVSKTGVRRANIDGRGFSDASGEWLDVGDPWTPVKAAALGDTCLWPLPAPEPACDEIRVGDYVRVSLYGWREVTSVASDRVGFNVDGEGCGALLEAVDGHRPAPRIPLPDGREVVPDAMWRYPDGSALANVDGAPWASGLDGAFRRVLGASWSDAAGGRKSRIWPPPEVEVQEKAT